MCTGASRTARQSPQVPLRRALLRQDVLEPSGRAPDGLERPAANVRLHGLGRFLVGGHARPVVGRGTEGVRVLVVAARGKAKRTSGM